MFLPNHNTVLFSHLPNTGTVFSPYQETIHNPRLFPALFPEWHTEYAGNRFGLFRTDSPPYPEYTHWYTAYRQESGTHSACRNKLPRQPLPYNCCLWRQR